jgi:hypothetical protein
MEMGFKKAEYISQVKQVKEEILSSRYTAVKPVNKELLLLYFKMGKLIHQRIEKESRGTKVIETISKDLQKNLQGLRGFSTTNLKYMKQFYEMYSFLEISQSSTDQFISGKTGASRSLPPEFITHFFSVSFTHHYKLTGKLPQKLKKYLPNPDDLINVLNEPVEKYIVN